MAKSGYLFDLDGVLIDSEREYTRIWTEINNKYPSGKADLPYIIKGQTLSKILSDNYPDPEEMRQVSDELHRLEREMKYSYCPSARDFLVSLQSRGLKIAIVTSSDEVKMAHLYKDVPDLRNFPEIIIDASMVVKSKPHPEGYLKGARELGVDIKNCAVFEDSVQGVKAGKAAGAYVIGITGTKKREELEPYSDIVIDSLDEIEIEKLEDYLKRR